MQYEIIYKKVKNWYARIDSDGIVKITIPKILRYNQKFKDELIHQAQKMYQKYQKKQQVDALTEHSLQLFWEQVSLKDLDLSPFKKSKTQSKYDKFFQQTLLEYIEPYVDKYASQLWYSYQNIKIKKLKSKRGSCSYDQKLVFNQQLVHLSTKLIIYVVVHEVCHLKEKNHSVNFRKLVETLCPDYKVLRKQLRSLRIVSIDE